MLMEMGWRIGMMSGLPHRATHELRDVFCLCCGACPDEGMREPCIKLGPFIVSCCEIHMD